MDRTAVDTSSDSVVEGSAGSALPRRRPQAEKPAEASVNWFGDAAAETSAAATEAPTPVPSATPAVPAPSTAPAVPVPSAIPAPPTTPAVPAPSTTPAPSTAPAVPESGPASPASPGRISFGFGDGPIGGGRPLAQPSPQHGVTDPVALPVAASPEPALWEPVPFEPAAPRATTVDGWANPAVWPDSDRIATAWPDDSADHRPAGRNEPAVWSDTPAAPPRRRQSRLVTFGMGLLGTVAVAVIALTGVVYYTGPDTEISEMLQLGNKAEQRTVSGPLDGRTVGTFELLAATDRVRLSIADLGTDLYRINTADGAGIRPNADVRDDRLTLDLTRDEAGTGGEVEVVLAARVRWTLRFSGYAAERIVDLSNGRVTRIEMVGGTRRAEMTLAEASGTVPMKITGGIEELVLRAPAESPVRVKVGGGAGTVTAGSRTLRDLPPGATLTPKDWQGANRYDVEAASAITLLTVEQKKP